MGVKAEAGGRVEEPKGSATDRTAEAGGGRVEAAGTEEESGLADGEIGEASAEDDWAADGGMEEGGSVVEGDGASVDLMVSGRRSGDR